MCQLSPTRIKVRRPVLPSSWTVKHTHHEKKEGKETKNRGRELGSTVIV